MHLSYANERTPGMLMSALQRTSGMLMNALPAHCNVLQRTPDMLMNALLAHSQRTPVHFTYTNECTSSTLPAHFFLI